MRKRPAQLGISARIAATHLKIGASFRNFRHAPTRKSLKRTVLSPTRAGYGNYTRPVIMGIAARSAFISAPKRIKLMTQTADYPLKGQHRRRAQGRQGAVAQRLGRLQAANPRSLALQRGRGLPRRHRLQIPVEVRRQGNGSAAI